MQTLLKTVRLLALGFVIACASSCQPKIIVSPTEDPLWLDKGQVTPHEGWLVTQGWMADTIEGTE